MLMYLFAAAGALGLVSILVGVLSNLKASSPAEVENHFQLSRARCVLCSFLHVRALLVRSSCWSHSQAWNETCTITWLEPVMCVGLFAVSVWNKFLNSVESIIWL